LGGIDFANVFSNIGSEPLVHHGISYPPLRGVSEVQDPISDRFQSVPEWIVPGADGPALLGGMDVVLFLRDPADFESMERQRHEDVCRIQPGASSRVRTAGGDRVGKPEGALLRAGPNRQNLLRKGSGPSARTKHLPGTFMRAASDHSVEPKTSRPALGSPNHLKDTNRDREDSNAHCDFARSGDAAATMRQKADNFFQPHFAAAPAAFVAPVAMPFSTTSTTFPTCLAASDRPAILEKWRAVATTAGEAGFCFRGIQAGSGIPEKAFRGKPMLYAEKA
jgi:hypothetical protein